MLVLFQQLSGATVSSFYCTKLTMQSEPLHIHNRFLSLKAKTHFNFFFPIQIKQNIQHIK